MVRASRVCAVDFESPHRRASAVSGARVPISALGVCSRQPTTATRHSGQASPCTRSCAHAATMRLMLARSGPLSGLRPQPQFEPSPPPAVPALARICRSPPPVFSAPPASCVVLALIACMLVLPPAAPHAIAAARTHLQGAPPFAPTTPSASLPWPLAAPTLPMPSAAAVTRRRALCHCAAMPPCRCRSISAVTNHQSSAPFGCHRFVLLPNAVLLCAAL